VFRRCGGVLGRQQAGGRAGRPPGANAFNSQQAELSAITPPEYFERQVAPILQSNGVHIEGIFVTESAPNTYPRLPVREGEHVLVWFGVLNGQVITTGWLERLAITTSLGSQQASLLELEPTPRSVLGRGAAAARASKHGTRS
jgi:hypothetical protein